ncbi:MAG: nuclear transport factor 2 family protein [Flavobacteriaceae bacterium]|nr:nuclear transport factor 2 family protein [Flavobacteriaceae bacterium]
MKKYFHIAIILLALVFSCKDANQEEVLITKWKQEIVDTEAAFAKMAKKQGINKAFVAYAADEAVLMRGNQLIKGKEAITKFMKLQVSKGLAWKPDYVEVSTSGDLGYTYGYYTFTYQDSTGNNVESKGVFHSVWKRQDDGSWKFVWD